MIISIEFDPSSDNYEDARETLTGIPSGTILSSSNSMHIMSRKILTKFNHTIYCFYLDENILETRYAGVSTELDNLRNYYIGKGVKNINILPIYEKKPSNDNEYNYIVSLVEKILDC